MLTDILEFLLYAGWKTIDGNYLEKSVVYDSETHMTNVIWVLGSDRFSVNDVSKITLSFDLNTFKIWTREE